MNSPEPLSSIVPPDFATASDDDVARVQAHAMELVGQGALSRARRGALLAGSVSDLARVNRAEGLSLGMGLRRHLGPLVEADVRGRYGAADNRWKGALNVTWHPSAATSLRLGAFDEVRDATDVAEASGVRNSIGAQEFAADFTEPYYLRGFERATGAPDRGIVVHRVARDGARVVENGGGRGDARAWHVSSGPGGGGR